MSQALQVMADRLMVSSDECYSVLYKTIMPNGGKSVTQEQFTAFLMVANEFKLNPVTKEIYAFPAKGGGIQAVISIDGWLKIANHHSKFDGFEYGYEHDGGKLISVTCHVFRKDRRHSIAATEFMEECRRPTDPWKTHPKRMLKHRATCQAIRYAFGVSGIMEQDEYLAFMEKEINPMPEKRPTAMDLANNTVDVPEKATDVDKATGEVIEKKTRKVAKKKPQETEDPGPQVDGLWLLDQLHAIHKMNTNDELTEIYKQCRDVCEEIGDKGSLVQVVDACTKQKAVILEK